MEKVENTQVIWTWFRRLLVWLGICSPVPKKILKNPPLTEVAPEGYKIIKSYDFASKEATPPNEDLDTCEVWGVNHISRKDGGMYNPDGSVVPPDDPRNFCEWNPSQVQWDNGKLKLVTDLNPGEGKTPVVAGLIATIQDYWPPVFVAARIKVAPKGGRYWTSFVSYSKNGWIPENDFQEFECFNSKMFTTSTHRIIDGKYVMPTTHKVRLPVDLSEAFHIYSALILRDSISIYLDNVLVYEHKMDGLNVEPAYFLIGNAIFQGCNPKLISPENLKEMFPMSASVDWFKIYQP